MLLKDRYLVVASLIAGRNFPKRPQCHLIAEAKFDGEVLTTDPVSHNTETPQLDQELAWELDKKSLSQHRLQRSSIKVQLYAADSQSPVKEAVGYIMLDLRSASDQKLHKWYPVLHSKYAAKCRPEVYVGLFLDHDGQQLVPEGGEVGMSGLASSVDPSLLRPVLHNDAVGGYYQVGPEKLCREMFVLSVVVAKASGLSHLIPTNVHLPTAGDSGFYFHFALLGNTVTTEPFADLVSAEFPAERSSVRIRSTLDMLRVFFDREPAMELHLCCGDQSLGSSNIPMSRVLRGVDHAFNEPAILEDVYTMEAPARFRSASDGERSSVAVSVIMRRESVPAPQPGFKGSYKGQGMSGKGGPLRLHSPPVRERDGLKGGRDSRDDGYGAADWLDLPGNPRVPCSTPISRNNNKGNLRRSISASSVLDSAACHGTSMEREEFGESSNMRRFCYTIELRSVRGLTADVTKSVYARYVYPIFGSAAPIMTHPPVEIRRHQEVTLPQGYCSFEFGATLDELITRLQKNPLIVEIFVRDRTRGPDTMLGTAPLDLASVFPRNPVFPKKAEGKPSTLSTSAVASVRSPEGQNQKVGDIVYSLTIEDLGPMPDQALPFTTPVRRSEETGVRRQRRRSGGDVDTRGTQEYRAALELEAWKEAEESKFRIQLKEMEKQQMLTLAEEWRKRDKEREMITKKKIGEYQELEDSLRSAVLSLSRRERSLAAGEAELVRLRADLEREHERKMQDLREASRRLTEDCQHKATMEAEKARHWETQCKEWQSKHQALDRDFTKFKASQSLTSESRLHSELGQAQVERAELERKLEGCVKAKLHYKQMWGKALKELARLKQREEQVAKEQLKRQETELEHMRLRYLASEETALTGGGPGKGGKLSELEEIKREIERLRQDSARQTDEAGTVMGGGGGVGDEDLGMEDHLARLIEERDSLLRTGVYSMEDQIIAELDREIRRCIASVGGGLSPGYGQMVSNGYN